MYVNHLSTSTVTLRALNIPPDALLGGAPELRDVPKETPIIVYCRTGSRSNVAMHILSGMGYRDITNGINKERVEADYGL
jgi:rhodanese-related sulfurtransferase